MLLDDAGKGLLTACSNRCRAEAPEILQGKCAPGLLVVTQQLDVLFCVHLLRGTSCRLSKAVLSTLPSRAKQPQKQCASVC